MELNADQLKGFESTLDSTVEKLVDSLTPPHLVDAVSALEKKRDAAFADVSARLSVLEKHNIRPPRGYDLMPTSELLKWLEEKERENAEIFKKKPPTRDEQLKQAASAFIRFDKDKRKYQVDYSGVASWVRQQMNTISFRKEVWVYKDGFYHRNQDEIEALIKEFFDAGEWTGSILTATREILFQIRATSPELENPFNIRPDLVPVENGVVQIDYTLGTVRLLPHSPEYQFIYRLPVRYDKDAPVEPVLSVLSSWVSSEQLPSLLQFPAQAILQAQLKDSFKKAYLFDGEADAGKTTYVKLIRLFFGKDQTADVDLRALCGNRFALAVLEGRLINFHDDLGEFQLYFLGPFKKVTGDVWHRLERKGENSYDGLITAVHGFTCNGPPKIENITDSAFFSRWNYIEFPNSFPRDPTWATRTFTPAFLSGFLNLIIKTMINIRRTTPPILLHNMDQLEVSELWIHSTDPLSLFIDMHFIREPGFHVGANELYEGWVRYCKEENINPKTKTAVTQALGRIQIHARKISSGRLNVYDGIRWRDDSPYRAKTPNQQLVE